MESRHTWVLRGSFREFPKFWQDIFLRHLAGRSKAALTACKTNANAIHCPPLLQAEIDMWSGILNAHEKDFRTAYSSAEGRSAALPT